MPIVSVSEELKTFLNEITSEKYDFPKDVLRISVSLRKTKEYADSQGIELRVYQEPFGPLLRDEVKELAEKGRQRLPFLSIQIVSDGQKKNILLIPSKLLELLRQDKKKWLLGIIDTLLHEIAHIEEPDEEEHISIQECPYAGTSCLYEEVELLPRCWKLREVIGIRKLRKPFVSHFLRGIFSPVHLACFGALEDNTCPLKDLIEKNKYYRDYVKPIREKGRSLANT